LGENPLKTSARSRRETADYLVAALDMFEGQVSMEELLRTDLWLVSEMMKAKERLIEAKAKQREKALAAQAIGAGVNKK
jgi:hypothetical protein